MQIWRFSHPRLRFFFTCGSAFAAWRPRSTAGSPPSQAPPSYFSLSPLRPSSGFRPPAAPVAARYGPFSPTAPHTCPQQLCSALQASPSRFALLAPPLLHARASPCVPLRCRLCADRESNSGQRLCGGAFNHYTTAEQSRAKPQGEVARRTRPEPGRSRRATMTEKAAAGFELGVKGFWGQLLNHYTKPTPTQAERKRQ